MRLGQTAAIAATLIITASAQALAASAPVAASAVPVAAGPPPIDDKVWHTFFIWARPVSGASAPADEYFGRYRLSLLGMRNIIHDMSIEGDSSLALPLQEGRIYEVAGALGDWANRYPRDKWLPGTAASFVRFLERKKSPETALLAANYIAYLNDRFAGTPSAKWYAALSASHDPVIGIDLLAAPVPYRIYGTFDPDVLRLGRGIPKP